MATKAEKAKAAKEAKAAKAKADKEAAADPTATVDPEGEKAAELVVVPGTTLDLYRDGDSIFTNALSADMDVDERKGVIRNVLQKTQQMDGRLNLVQGEMLHEVSSNGYWKDWDFKDKKTGETRKFASYDEYCEVEMELGKRKAQYYVDIYKTFVVKLDIPRETLVDLEWTKVRELTKIVNEENWPDLLEKIQNMTVKEVKEMVAEMRSKTGGKGGDGDGDGTGGASGATGGGDPETFENIKFRLSAEQMENVNGALAIAASMTTSEKQGNQLDLICSDFVAGAAGAGLEGALAKLDVCMKNLERAFGVTLKILDVDEVRYAKLKGTEGDADEDADDDDDGEGEEADAETEAAAV